MAFPGKHGLAGRKRVLGGGPGPIMPCTIRVIIGRCKGNTEGVVFWSLSRYQGGSSINSEHPGLAKFGAGVNLGPRLSSPLPGKRA